MLPPAPLFSNLPVLVEESRGERDSLHDKLQVFDAFTILLKRHTSRVVNVDDNVVESEAHNIHGDLTRDSPRSDQLVYALRGTLGSLLNARVAGRVEALKALLLDGLLKLLHILTNVLWGRRLRWATSELALLLLGRCAVLLTTRWSLGRILLLLTWWRRTARVGLGSSLCKVSVSILFNPDPREYCSACEDEHSRRGLAEEIQGSSCTAKGCMAQDCKEPADRTKAAQAEVASSRRAADVVVAHIGVVAARTEVAVAGTGVPGHTAVVAARAIGSHHSEGMVTGCFAADAVGEALGKASMRLVVVARARHRHRHRQQPTVLREAYCRVEKFGAVEWVCDRGCRRTVGPEGVGAR
jgi:hypothetical protein